jgi:anthranilate phosphoribosyltransferase
MIREALAAIVAGKDLTEAEAAAVMEELMTDQATPSQAGALLTALRMKGETVEEIAGMVRVMRQKALPLQVDGEVLDVVSTGGGAFDPFNISTAASLVCAGAGVRVAKHGNRGFTSSSGAADVLEALGVKLELSPEQVKACIEQTGFGFLFAPSFHPAMRFVGPTRREIGFRTIFNSLGPLTNPAGAQYQLLGVGDAAMADKVAAVAGRLGTGRALIVHSDDGLDEVSLSGPTQVRDVQGNQVSGYRVTPEELGLEMVPLYAVKTGNKEENAARLRAVLDGARTPDRDYTIVNAATALVAVNRAKDIRSGVPEAAEAVDSGAAKRVLEAYIEASNSFGVG